eukprot:TRINITY_DN32058_c0_g1_i1.p2 TRINITY_DN32058_c0_g1~~TRINITY_DN32058_c0_g1_i1.p2  ORF type:complete len:218 (+),score=90.64 TRINITY_DN32058_c0_g1_i1:58-711(+)
MMLRAAGGGAAGRQLRHPHFTPTMPSWKVNQTAATYPTMKLFKKQMHSSHEWEQIGSPHNYLRQNSPGEPGTRLKGAALWGNAWASNYQLETLRQTGTSPQYREHVPNDPFYRDVYYEWLHRNWLDDHPGPENNYIFNYDNQLSAKERMPRVINTYENATVSTQNLDMRARVKDEIRQEKFEDYMRRRAKRNKILGIDQYGTWSKKTLAYLKKQGDY